MLLCDNFANETFNEVLIRRELLGKHFDGDESVERDLLGEKDSCHRASAELSNDAETRNLLAGFHRFNVTA